MGLLNWTPSEFWAATMFDLSAAIDGWRIAQGDDPEGEKALARQLHAVLDKKED